MAETFGAVHSLLLSTSSVDLFLGELASLAARIVDPPTSCGITVRREHQPLTVANSDGRAALADESQYSNGEGPCLEALDTGELVSVPDLTAEARWLKFRAHALEQGVRCSLSLPLIVSGRPMGALNLYGFEAPNAFGGIQATHAEVFAAQASTALTLLIRQIKQTDISTQLEQALSSRSVIDQAMGIIMGQQHCSANEAFGVLRRHSQNSNVKLRDVAADLVTRATGQPPEDAPPFHRADARPES